MHDPLPTPREMSLWDKKTIKEFGILPEILMENASREALNFLKNRFGSLKDKSALVFAGSGNNGGDAFALARHLANHEVTVMVLYAKKKESYGKTSAYHLSLLEKMGVTLMYLPDYNLDFLKHVDIIVDGLLGTGFNGSLRPEFRAWIKSINKLKSRSYIFSLDIPSGINGVTGEPSDTAVRADATVTFEEPKLGLALPPANDYVGHLHVGKIGIPRKIKQDHPPTHFALTAKIMHLIQRPQKTMHKGDAGHVVVFGGSPGLTGAPMLSALGAVRSGAGLTTIACPGRLASEVKAGWPDIMILPAGDTDSWEENAAGIIPDAVSRADAVVFGPGLGRGESSRQALIAYLREMHPKTVFDADALYFFANDHSLFEYVKGKTDVIFTPHPGEMARFFGVSSVDINMDRAGYAQKFINEFQSKLILKGAGTIVAAPRHPFFISPFAVPNLALGGAGDVLAGMTGSLMARGYSSLQAASIAVYWHGLTGNILQKKYPYRGNTAQEIAHTLPKTLAEAKDA
ncbi:MAG: NAD(P)H-hydrate dehydratase [Desulfonatronovibrionaceae bacterium]